MSSSLEQQYLLDLPVVCLSTANFDLTLKDAVEGKRTVIDFWTTQCTRCPAALDDLDAIATEDTSRTQYISICCDSLDGAREILERPDAETAWNSMGHYYMSFEYKEQAKRILGFRKVPFYVVVDAQGVIVHTGNKLPEDVVPRPAAPSRQTDAEKVPRPNTPPQSEKEVVSSSPTSSAFVIEDLDF